MNKKEKKTNKQFLIDSKQIGKIEFLLTTSCAFHRVEFNS